MVLMAIMVLMVIMVIIALVTLITSRAPCDANYITMEIFLVIIIIQYLRYDNGGKENTVRETSATIEHFS